MRYLAALTAFGLLASTAAYAQNAPQAQSPSSQNQAAETHEPQALAQPFVRQLQMRLRAQGAYQGEPTGTWDEATSKAVKDFQQENKIQPTGQIDERTIAALLQPAGTEGEGSSTPPASATPPTIHGGMGMAGMRMPVVRSFERGYSQGFEEGLRWAQEQEQEQEQ